MIHAEIGGNLVEIRKASGWRYIYDRFASASPFSMKSLDEIQIPLLLTLNVPWRKRPVSAPLSTGVHGVELGLQFQIGNALPSF